MDTPRPENTPDDPEEGEESVSASGEDKGSRGSPGPKKRPDGSHKRRRGRGRKKLDRATFYRLLDDHENSLPPDAIPGTSTLSNNVIALESMRDGETPFRRLRKDRRKYLEFLREFCVSTTITGRDLADGLIAADMEPLRLRKNGKGEWSVASRMTRWHAGHAVLIVLLCLIIFVVPGTMRNSQWVREWRLAEAGMEVPSWSPPIGTPGMMTPAPPSVTPAAPNPSATPTPPNPFATPTAANPSATPTPTPAPSNPAAPNPFGPSATPGAAVTPSSSPTPAPTPAPALMTSQERREALLALGWVFPDTDPFVTERRILYALTLLLFGMVFFFFARAPAAVRRLERMTHARTLNTHLVRAAGFGARLTKGSTLTFSWWSRIGCTGFVWNLAFLASTVTALSMLLGVIFIAGTVWVRIELMVTMEDFKVSLIVAAAGVALILFGIVWVYITDLLMNVLRRLGVSPEDRLVVTADWLIDHWRSQEGSDRN